MFAFVETAHKAEWRPGEPKPLAVLFALGEPKLRDIAIFARALRPGEVLRVVMNLPSTVPQVQAFCDANGLVAVYVTADRALTKFGCYAHYYVDVQLAPESSGVPTLSPTL